MLRYEHQAAIRKDLGKFQFFKTQSQSNRLRETSITCVHSQISFKGIQHDNEPEATANNHAAVPDFSIEYAKTDQEACKGCTQKIQTAELRILQFVPEVSDNQNDVIHITTGQTHLYHVLCFVRLRSEIGWLRSGDSLPGFKRLNPNDKSMIENQIPYV